jgi:hypothetical protein
VRMILLAFALAAAEPPGDLWQTWEHTFAALPALSRAAIERCTDEMGDSAEQRDKLACRHLDYEQRNNAALLWYYRRYAPK